MKHYHYPVKVEDVREFAHPDPDDAFGDVFRWGEDWGVANGFLALRISSWLDCERECPEAVARIERLRWSFFDLPTDGRRDWGKLDERRGGLWQRGALDFWGRGRSGGAAPPDRAEGGRGAVLRDHLPGRPPADFEAAEGGGVHGTSERAGLAVLPLQRGARHRPVDPRRAADPRISHFPRPRGRRRKGAAVSVRATTAAWYGSRASGTTKLVLLAIADCANDEGGNAWPSMATIALKCGLESERSAQRHVRSLVEMGELRVDANMGRRGSNLYHVQINILEGNFKKPRLATPTNPSPRQNCHPNRQEPSEERERERAVTLPLPGIPTGSHPEPD